MASPVYSKLFISAPSFSGPAVTQYTVPAGYLAVVKFISVVWGDITASGLDAWIQTSDLCKLMRFTWAFGFSTPYNLGGVFSQYGTTPVEAGDTLATQTAAGTCDFKCGGYLLSLP